MPLSNLASWTLYGSLVLLRFLLIYRQQPGYIHPDEFFQSLEIAAGDVYGLDVHRTWEFDPNEPGPLRSIAGLGPLVHLPIWVYKRVADAEVNAHSSQSPPKTLSGNELLDRIVFPVRLFTGLGSLATDLFVFVASTSLRQLHKPSRRRCGLTTPPPAALLLYASMAFGGTLMAGRTLVNTWEMIAVSWFGLFYLLLMRHLSQRHKTFKPSRLILTCALCAQAMLSIWAIFLRPTYALFILPMALSELWTIWQQFGVQSALLPSSICVVLMAFVTRCCLVIDTAYFRLLPMSHWLSNFKSQSFMDSICVPCRFFNYNSNTAHVAEHGLHGRYMHTLVNLPLLFGPAVVLLLRQPKHSLRSMHTVFLSSVLVPLLVLSIVPHQELRFLLPLVPVAAVLIGVQLETPTGWFQTVYQSNLGSLLSLSWFVHQLLLLLFYGSLHQGGLVPFLQSIPSTSRGSDCIQYVFYHTYMPPRFPFGRLKDQSSDWCNTVLDLGGANYTKLESVLAETQTLAPRVDGVRNAVEIIFPGSLSPLPFNLSNYGRVVSTRLFFGHLSTEDWPRPRRLQQEKEKLSTTAKLNSLDVAVYNYCLQISTHMSGVHDSQFFMADDSANFRVHLPDSVGPSRLIPLPERRQLDPSFLLPDFYPLTKPPLVTGPIGLASDVRHRFTRTPQHPPLSPAQFMNAPVMPLASELKETSEDTNTSRTKLPTSNIHRSVILSLTDIATSLSFPTFSEMSQRPTVPVFHMQHTNYAPSVQPMEPLRIAHVSSLQVPLAPLCLGSQANTSRLGPGTSTLGPALVPYTFSSTVQPLSGCAEQPAVQSHVTLLNLLTQHDRIITPTATVHPGPPSTVEVPTVIPAPPALLFYNDCPITHSADLDASFVLMDSPSSNHNANSDPLTSPVLPAITMAITNPCTTTSTRTPVSSHLNSNAPNISDTTGDEFQQHSRTRCNSESTDPPPLVFTFSRSKTANWEVTATNNPELEQVRELRENFRKVRQPESADRRETFRKRKKTRKSKLAALLAKRQRNKSKPLHSSGTSSAKRKKTDKKKTRIVKVSFPVAESDVNINHFPSTPTGQTDMEVIYPSPNKATPPSPVNQVAEQWAHSCPYCSFSASNPHRLQRHVHQRHAALHAAMVDSQMIASMDSRVQQNLNKVSDGVRPTNRSNELLDLTVDTLESSVGVKTQSEAVPNAVKTRRSKPVKRRAKKIRITVDATDGNENITPLRAPSSELVAPNRSAPALPMSPQAVEQSPLLDLAITEEPSLVDDIITLVVPIDSESTPKELGPLDSEPHAMHSQQRGSVVEQLLDIAAVTTACIPSSELSSVPVSPCATRLPVSLAVLQPSETKRLNLSGVVIPPVHTESEELHHVEEPYIENQVLEASINIPPILSPVAAFPSNILVESIPISPPVLRKAHSKQPDNWGYECPRTTRVRSVAATVLDEPTMDHSDSLKKDATRQNDKIRTYDTSSCETLVSPQATPSTPPISLKSVLQFPVTEPLDLSVTDCSSIVDLEIVSGGIEVHLPKLPVSPMDQSRGQAAETSIVHPCTSISELTSVPSSAPASPELLQIMVKPPLTAINTQDLDITEKVNEVAERTPSPVTCEQPLLQTEHLQDDTDGEDQITETSVAHPCTPNSELRSVPSSAPASPELLQIMVKPPLTAINTQDLDITEKVNEVAERTPSPVTCEQPLLQTEHLQDDTDGEDQITETSVAHPCTPNSELRLVPSSAPASPELLQIMVKPPLTAINTQDLDITEKVNEVAERTPSPVTCEQPLLQTEHLQDDTDGEDQITETSVAHPCTPNSELRSVPSSAPASPELLQIMVKPSLTAINTRNLNMLEQLNEIAERTPSPVTSEKSLLQTENLQDDIVVEDQIAETSVAHPCTPIPDPTSVPSSVPASPELVKPPLTEMHTRDLDMTEKVNEVAERTPSPDTSDTDTSQACVPEMLIECSVRLNREEHGQLLSQLAIMALDIDSSQESEEQQPKQQSTIPSSYPMAAALPSLSPTSSSDDIIISSDEDDNDMIYESLSGKVWEPSPQNGVKCSPPTPLPHETLSHADQMTSTPVAFDAKTHQNSDLLSSLRGSSHNQQHHTQIVSQEQNGSIAKDKSIVCSPSSKISPANKTAAASLEMSTDQTVAMSAISAHYSPHFREITKSPPPTTIISLLNEPVCETEHVGFTMPPVPSSEEVPIEVCLSSVPISPSHMPDSVPLHGALNNQTLSPPQLGNSNQINHNTDLTPSPPHNAPLLLKIALKRTPEPVYEIISSPQSLDQPSPSPNTTLLVESVAVDAFRHSKTIGRKHGRRKSPHRPLPMDSSEVDYNEPDPLPTTCDLDLPMDIPVILGGSATSETITTNHVHFKPPKKPRRDRHISRVSGEHKQRHEDRCSTQSSELQLPSDPPSHYAHTRYTASPQARLNTVIYSGGGGGDPKTRIMVDPSSGEIFVDGHSLYDLVSGVKRTKTVGRGGGGGGGVKMSRKFSASKTRHTASLLTSSKRAHCSHPADGNAPKRRAREKRTSRFNHPKKYSSKNSSQSSIALPTTDVSSDRSSSSNRDKPTTTRLVTSTR